MHQHVATYEEIRRYWDLHEVLEANEWLDVKEDAEWRAMEEARPKAARR